MPISSKKSLGKRIFPGEGKTSKAGSASFMYLCWELGSLGDFCLLCLVSLTTSQFEFWPLTWQKWLTEEEGIKLLQSCGEILSETAWMLTLPIQLEHHQIYHPTPPNIHHVAASSQESRTKNKFHHFCYVLLLYFMTFPDMENCKISPGIPSHKLLNFPLNMWETKFKNT